MSGSDTDPYRTQVGSSLSRPKLFVSLGLVVAGGLALILVASANNLEIGVDDARWPIIAITVGILMVFMVLAMAVKRNR